MNIKRAAWLMAPVLAVSFLVPLAPAQAAGGPTNRNGTTAELAAASCWEIKQTNPASVDGTYWLQTPQLGAPQQFYCDMTTEGGGWVLVGRGRTGWTWNQLGKDPAKVATTPTGTSAFSAAYLSDDTVDGLLAGTNVKDLTDGVRLKRARNSTGTTWQDTRLRYSALNKWSWQMEANYPVTCRFDSAGPVSGTSRDCSMGNDDRRVFTFAWANHKYQAGFSYGSTVVGSNSATSYLWQSTTENHAIPFTQVWLRPRITQANLNYANVPDAGLPAKAQRAIASNTTSTATPWGVTGVVGNPNNELETEVEALQQVGNRMYVGGHFQYVQKGATPAAGEKVEQRFLAAFDLNTGEWISSFRPVLNGAVRDIQALPNGQILVAGHFTAVGGDARYQTLVSLNPANGAVSPGWGLKVYRSQGDAAYVRTLDLQDGKVYFGGKFNRTDDWKNLSPTGTTVTQRPANLGRMDANSYVVDWKWRPTVGSAVVALDASSRGDNVYFAGYFNTVNGVATQNAAAVTTAEGAPLVPGFQPFIGSAGGKDEYQQAIIETGGNNVWVGGSEHNLWRENRDTGARLDGYITTPGGDFQAIAEVNGVVYSGGHARNTVYSDTYQWPSAAGFSRADRINYVAAWDAVTGDLITSFVPTVDTARARGPWALTGDTNGCLWIGGDFNRGSWVNGAYQWLGGFGKLCPVDSTAPAAPTNLRGTVQADGSLKLQWNAVADAVSYQVFAADRIVSNNKGATVTLRNNLQGRYWVRAVDAEGNVSATTPVLELAL